jgi:hypothetical protein
MEHLLTEKQLTALASLLGVAQAVVEQSKDNGFDGTAKAIAEDIQTIEQMIYGDKAFDRQKGES